MNKNVSLEISQLITKTKTSADKIYQDYRHSDGMYLAGIAFAAVTTVLLVNPRPEDTTFVALVQAQSIEPREVASGTTYKPKVFFALGDKLKVKPFNPVGTPFPAVAAIATETTQLPELSGNAGQGLVVGTSPAGVL